MDRRSGRVFAAVRFDVGGNTSGTIMAALRERIVGPADRRACRREAPSRRDRRADDDRRCRLATGSATIRGKSVPALDKIAACTPAALAQCLSETTISVCAIRACDEL